MTATTPNLKNHTDQCNLYAAIDLGSNSFHMIIARQIHGQMQIIDKHKEMVRLRAGLDAKGQLTPKAFQTGIQCLKRFGQLIANLPAQNVRAVGTNTLRNAKNSPDFLKAARKALGHEIQIIAGQEEARLIYLGVAHGLPQSNDQRLVMDIGGGSTEYIIGQHFQYQHLTSTEMGCVSISQTFFPDGTLTEKQFQKAIKACRQILLPHKNRLKKLGWDIAYGASGTIKSVGAILKENGWGEQITPEGLQHLQTNLTKAGHIQKINLPGFKDERRPVLAGGLAILIATFQELKIKQMHISNNALREGLIFDTLGRLLNEDVRENSVNSMQNWMKIDKEQAKHVAQTAHKLYIQAHNIWKLHNPDYNYTKLLQWAADLHEIGMAISYKRYRHHSAYIIGSADMPGFSQQETQILAAMLLNHRGKIHTDAYQNLPDPHHQKIPLLTVLLRLAVRIHRGRDYEQPDPILHIETQKLHLEFKDHWLDKHPLTAMDLKIEAKRLQAAGFELSYQ
ncbi:MAG TPA: exopolyphosphatase [Desulfobacterales bacterium]|nr:exopolyphosphatase [Desulfobacterales bacterium]